MLRLISALLMLAGPAWSQSSLEKMQSTDIVAEIEYLTKLLPPPRRITGNDRQAFEFFLASISICEGMEYEEYAQFVDNITASFSSEFQMRLGQRSYDIRASKGCSVDLDNKRIVESYLGDLETRSLILESLRLRREEMLRRTLLVVE